jgi:phospholipase D
MRKTILAAVAAAALLSASAQAQTLQGPVTAQIDTCFVPSAESCTDRIVTAIDGARSEIRVISYSLTSRPIIDALANAHGRGVDVEIIADRRNTSGPMILAALGVGVWYDTVPGLEHNKPMVIDRRLVIGGSFNLTYSAQHRNGENVTLIQSDAIADRFLGYFAARLAVSRPANGQ